MQLPIKVNPHQPCVCISQNEIDTTDVESGLERPVVQCNHCLAKWALSTNSSWDHNLHRTSTTTLISVTLPTYAWPFSYNWWLDHIHDYTYMCLLHEPTLNSYALMHEAYTVQIYIPSLYNSFGQLSTPYHYTLVRVVCTEHYHLGDMLGVIYLVAIN